MSCNCNKSILGSNCSCSIPITYANTGPQGIQGIAGNNGNNGVAVLYHIYANPYPTTINAVYNGDITPYTLDCDIDLVDIGDYIHIRFQAVLSSLATGDIGIHFNNTLIGGTYNFGPTGEKVLILEGWINKMDSTSVRNLVVANDYVIDTGTVLQPSSINSRISDLSVTTTGNKDISIYLNLSAGYVVPIEMLVEKGVIV